MTKHFAFDDAVFGLTFGIEDIMEIAIAGAHISLTSVLVIYGKTAGPSKTIYQSTFGMYVSGACRRQNT
jgi:hypothetical protein